MQRVNTGSGGKEPRYTCVKFWGLVNGAQQQQNTDLDAFAGPDDDVGEVRVRAIHSGCTSTLVLSGC